MYEGAAHRTPIHRVLAIATTRSTPPDFVARRQSAYGSGSIMLRDTPQGYRYSEERRHRHPNRRLLAGRADRVRTHRRRRDSRSEHFGAAALCRAQLRRFQFSRYRHADQRVLRRHLRTIRVLGAVARRQPLAVRRSRVRNRVVLQRSSRSSTGANSTTTTSSSGRHRWPSGSSGR